MAGWEGLPLSAGNREPEWYLRYHSIQNIKNGTFKKFALNQILLRELSTVPIIVRVVNSSNYCESCQQFQLLWELSTVPIIVRVVNSSNYCESCQQFQLLWELSTVPIIVRVVNSSNYCESCQQFQLLWELSTVPIIVRVVNSSNYCESCQQFQLLWELSTVPIIIIMISIFARVTIVFAKITTKNVACAIYDNYSRLHFVWQLILWEV